MKRKKKRSLVEICQSPRPTICRSSKLFPTTRFTKAKGTVIKVVPLETETFCTVPAGWGLPAVMPYGPNCCRAVTAGLPGKAVASAERPAGVGVRLEEVELLLA